MAWLVMWICSAVALGEPYLMNDVGGTLHTPAGWKMTRWSDWDFKASSKDGAILYKLWLTEYQSDVDEESAKIWAEDYIGKLDKEGAGAGKVSASTVSDVGGRPTVRTDVDFRFGGGTGKAGHARHAAFAGAGQVVHMRVISNVRNQKRAAQALDSMAESFVLDKGPIANGGGGVESESGFAATLPDGWRAPLGAEQGLTNKIVAKMWAGDLTQCWVGIKPPALGEPDLVFACKKYWDGGPVDAHSFDTVESEYRTLFFGAAGAEISKGEPLEIGDRLGAMFRPRDGENPIRLLVAPYDQGVMALWARGSSLEPAQLDEMLKSVAVSVKYTGPDGGKPKVRPDRWVGHYLSHRPTHPIVWAPALLLIGGIVVLIRRRKGHGPYAEFDDQTEV